MTWIQTCTIVFSLGALLVLLIASIIDIRTRRIPNTLVLLLFALWLIWRVTLGYVGAYFYGGQFAYCVLDLQVYGLATGLQGVGAAVVFGGGLLCVSALYEAIAHRESFGGGDVKLIAAIALFLGFQLTLKFLLIACVLGVFFALINHIIARMCDKPRTQTFPFAPAMFIAVLAVILTLPRL